MKRMKITAIIGSLRRNSFHRQLALVAKELLKEEADLEILEYADVPFLNQDYEYPAPAAVSRVRKIIQISDALWFFSPEYNHFFSGALKNLIDWLSRPISEDEPQVLKGKPATVSGITPGISGTLIAQDHLVSLISLLNMQVMNQPRLAIPSALQQLDQNGELVLSTSLPLLEKQANEFLNFVKKNQQ